MPKEGSLRHAQGRGVPPQRLVGTTPDNFIVKTDLKICYPGRHPKLSRGLPQTSTEAYWTTLHDPAYKPPKVYDLISRRRVAPPTQVDAI